MLGSFRQLIDRLFRKTSISRNSPLSVKKSIVDQLNEHWSWTGIEASEVVGQNQFGNLLVLDKSGKYWRITPEQLRCEVVAATSKEFAEIIIDDEFQLDWEMAAIVEIARQKCGPLKSGWVYYLVIPDLFGGLYEADNIRTAPLDELIYISGTWALEIKDLPEGGQVKLRIVD